MNSTANRNYFQAALTQEAEHLMYLETLGAKPLATKFYFPDDMFSKESVFFPTASLLEDYFISAYIAAAIEFSGAVSSGITTANPFAIGVAVQIMGIDVSTAPCCASPPTSTRQTIASQKRRC